METKIKNYDEQFGLIIHNYSKNKRNNNIKIGKLKYGELILRCPM